MTIQGMVVRGAQQARMLGYPTANIEYDSTYHIDTGVWTCWIMMAGVRYQGLAVVGMWVLAQELPSVEVHVLDFEREMYDQAVEVNFGKHLRSLIKFESVAALQRQIVTDVENARVWFLSH